MRISIALQRRLDHDSGLRCLRVGLVRGRIAAEQDRQLKLAIIPTDGSDPVLYSLGSAPSAIWRGAVLMRCGPAFDLQGGIRSGSRYLNRVVLDGVDRFDLHQPSGLPVLQMQLEQRTRLGGRVRSQGVG